jgi:hypothetical protein
MPVPTRARRLHAAIGIAALGWLGGCSSEAAPEPEPELRTPGAFVAVDEGGPGLALYRTLDLLQLDGQSDVFFVTHYDVAPADWDEAREVSRQDEIRLAEPVDALSEAHYPAGPYRIVWFRTLTAEERERVP